MAQAMSALFALLADQVPEVQEFREKVLGGTFLTHDEAHALIASHAVRLLSLEQFSAWGIPVTNHRADTLDSAAHRGKFNPVDEWTAIRVDPPGVTKRVRYAYSRNGDLSTRCVVKDGNVVPTYTGLPIERHGDHTYPSWLWPGSVIDELYELSEELADMFDWPRSALDTQGRPRNEAAAWFVLTGEVPEVHPVDVRWSMTGGGKYLNPQWRIQLTVPPWLPQEEVSQAYRLLRGEVSGGRELPKKTKSLEVARFVWEQERKNGYCEPPPWRTWCELWNEEHTDHRFKDYRHFRTYFSRGDAAVKELNFTWPMPRLKEAPSG